MGNGLERHKAADAVKWICTLLAFIVVGVLLAGLICGWFKSDKQTETKEEETAQINPLVINERESRGISLMSAVSVNEAGAQSSDSATITATLKPDNTAENTGVDWAINWKNPASAWANDKSVTSYVTLTAGNDYITSKTATLTCLQPFGEQIIVKATAKDNPEVTGTCSVDYAQKLNGISLSFGTVQCNFEGGRTGVILELNQNGTPTGGMPSITQEKDTIYTVADTFSVNYKITAHYEWLTTSPSSMPGSYPNSLMFGVYDTSNYTNDDSKILNHSVANKGLYFGVKWFVDNFDMHSLQSGRGNVIPGNIYSDTSVANIADRWNYRGTDNNGTYYDTNVDLFELTVTVSGKYSSLTKTTVFYMDGYTNATPINGMDLDKNSVVM